MTVTGTLMFSDNLYSPFVLDRPIKSVTGYEVDKTKTRTKGSDGEDKKEGFRKVCGRKSSILIL